MLTWLPVVDSVTTAGSSNVGVLLCQLNLSPENEIFFEKFILKLNLFSIVGGYASLNLLFYDGDF